MATKVISVYLMLSYLFITCVLGDQGDSTLKITSDEFAKFKGVDPTTHCGKPEEMKCVCNKLGTLEKFTDGKKCFISGFPQCIDTVVVVQKNCQDYQEAVTVLVCSWNEGHNLIVGKGKDANNFMVFASDQNGVCYFYKDVPYPTN